jgi:hypothetical protein
MLSNMLFRYSLLESRLYYDVFYFYLFLYIMPVNKLRKLNEATWAFGPMVISLPKEFHLSMRAWVRFPESPKYTCM